MLTRRIIPCLDVDRGKVIRGVKFSADKVVGDPVEMAAQYNRQGADELVFYDITASAEKRGLFVDVVRRVAEVIFIPFAVGGGIASIEAMREVLLERVPGVEVRDGVAESLPLADASVDVVISNGVIDLVPDKDAVFAEIDRVLRPGARLQIADVVIHTEVSEDGRKRIDLWTG